MPPSKSNLVTTSELSKIFEVQYGTIYQMARRGKIPFKLSKSNRYLFDFDAVWKSLRKATDEKPYKFPSEEEKPLLRLNRQEIIRRLTDLANEVRGHEYHNKRLRHVISNLITLLPPKHRKPFLKYASVLSSASGNFFTFCQHCHAVQISKDEWIRPDVYLGMFHNCRGSHGICPTCLPRYRSEAGLPIHPPKPKPIKEEITNA